MYNIYCDGAATMRKVNGEYVRENGGWAMIIYDENNNPIYGEYGGEQSTTNNAMELYAIYKALIWLSDDNTEATIYSDSAYCVNIFNDWAEKWEKNGWTRGRKKEPIENLTAIRTIYNKLKEKPNVKIVKVKGHASCRGNNVADSFAVAGKQAAAQYNHAFNIIDIKKIT